MNVVLTSELNSIVHRARGSSSTRSLVRTHNMLLVVSTADTAQLKGDQTETHCIHADCTQRYVALLDHVLDILSHLRGQDQRRSASLRIAECIPDERCPGMRQRSCRLRQFIHLLSAYGTGVEPIRLVVPL